MVFKKGNIPYSHFKGKKLSEEMRRKISLALKGHKGYWQGKTFSEETKLKVSLAKKGKPCSSRTKFKKGQFAKEKHRSWKGGITPINILLRKSKQAKDWRTAVFKRDDYTCRICDKSGCYIEPHHIMSWAGYPNMRFERANGITLCRECHNKTKNRGGFLGR